MSPTEGHLSLFDKSISVPSLKTTPSVELGDDVEGDFVAHGVGTDDCTAGSVPGAHLLMDVPFNGLLNDVLWDDALKHDFRKDNLAHDASTGDLAGISCKDLPEHVLAASVLANSLNEDIFENVPSIGMFYKDVSDSFEHSAATDKGALDQLIIPKGDASLQTGMFLFLGHLFFPSCLPSFAKINLDSSFFGFCFLQMARKLLPSSSHFMETICHFRSFLPMMRCRIPRKSFCSRPCLFGS